MPVLPRIVFFPAALIALLTGCSSPRESEAPPIPPAGVVDLPPVMAGTENFLDGAVTVRITLAMPGNYRFGKGGEPTNDAGGSSRRSAGGGRRQGDPPRPGANSDGSSSENQHPLTMGSTLPPAQLKLLLQNNSATNAVKCEVEDFNSYLGNFAVYPARYNLEPGQTAASEVMTSRLGVEGGDIAVTVALRSGGRLERKIVTLRLLAPAKDATP